MNEAAFLIFFIIDFYNSIVKNYKIIVCEFKKFLLIVSIKIKVDKVSITSLNRHLLFFVNFLKIDLMKF